MYVYVCASTYMYTHVSMNASICACIHAWHQHWQQPQQESMFMYVYIHTHVCIYNPSFFVCEIKVFLPNITMNMALLVEFVFQYFCILIYVHCWEYVLKTDYHLLSSFVDLHVHVAGRYSYIKHYFGEMLLTYTVIKFVDVLTK